MEKTLTYAHLSNGRTAPVFNNYINLAQPTSGLQLLSGIPGMKTSAPIIVRLRIFYVNEFILNQLS